MTASELLGLMAVIVLGAVAIWGALRIEPHWVSRDGRRFICRGQLVDDRGNVQSRWYEYRCRVTPDGEVAARRRAAFGRAGSGVWRVVARSNDPPPRRAVFLLHPTRGAGSMLALRLPATSRAVEVLDGISGRGSPPPARPPDRG